jgi:hypothetical protein
MSCSWRAHSSSFNSRGVRYPSCSSGVEAPLRGREFPPLRGLGCKGLELEKTRSGVCDSSFSRIRRALINSVRQSRFDSRFVHFPTGRSLN